MVSKVEVFLLGVMIIGWSSYVDAKNTEHSDMIVSSAVTARNENFCQLCQDFTTRTINFLKENETQTNIISNLHQVCFLLHSSKQQCISLVDCYSSILSAEIAKVEPKQLCDKVKFCEKEEGVHLIKNDDPCTICHNVVDEILTKLDDPDAQLQIIQTLLKGCNRIENFSHQCKKLVLEYGPILLVNAYKFFEKTDVCTAIHACKAHKEADIGPEFLAVSSA
ncbi:hypothetical protein KSP39_PZI017823 [Platanthera zijinensis]|uniref:Pulmonary surfactant-associated protein B n=1 Tax=Platanthera zijinensis TaxID=2320716 RepID=A0AAP0FZM4_9ASPA